MSRQQTWYKRLLRWVKSRFSKPSQTAPTDQRIIKTWESAWGTLRLIKRNTPEAVRNATFEFTPAYKPGVVLLLTCDQYRPLRNVARSNSQPSLLGLRYGSPIRGHPIPTHRLSLSLVRQAFASGSAIVKSSLLWSYPVDFIGANGLFADKDYFAWRITSQLAQLLLYELYEKIAWEESLHEITLKAVGSSHEIILNQIKNAV